MLSYAHQIFLQEWKMNLPEPSTASPCMIAPVEGLGLTQSCAFLQGGPHLIIKLYEKQGPSRMAPTQEYCLQLLSY